jgi:hypothetical protein
MIGLRKLYGINHRLIKTGTYTLGVYEDWGGLIGTTTVIIE